MIASRPPKLPIIIRALSLLEPHDVIDRRKIRVGNQNDGGYIMLDMFKKTPMAFSYGLSWNIIFELDLAQRGITVQMFDHTIDRLSIEHTLFRFHKEGIAAETDVEQRLHTLAEHLDRFSENATGMILKLDVEGAEWEALARAPMEILLRFDQIVIEFHNLQLLSDSEFNQKACMALSNLTENFHLFHVHANNCAPIVVVDSVPIADVIEASYVRKGLVDVARSSTFYPTSLDAPNDFRRSDHLLWFYPFMPTAWSTNAAAAAEFQNAALERIVKLSQKAQPTREEK